MHVVVYGEDIYIYIYIYIYIIYIYIYMYICIYSMWYHFDRYNLVGLGLPHSGKV